MRFKLLGKNMYKDIFTKIDNFVSSTLDVISLRREDSLLIVRPNKIQHVNATGFDMLYMLYSERKSAETTVDKISAKYSADKSIVLRDLSEIINTISAIMQENYESATMIQTIPYEPKNIALPILSEIALTYKCQNRCDFCYASSPYRGDEKPEMTTEEVKIIIDKIFDEAQVPTISFTGGEPTLRKDLPDLIAHASQRGMRTNLITNGIICSDPDFVKTLADAGLKSAQVSLESHDKDIHNKITGNRNAFQNTVQAVHNLKNAGIHTHTNTTICRGNREHLIPLVEFVKKEFNATYLSMNMIIATGIARDNENINIGYTTIEKIIKPVLKFCAQNEIKFVWYSPTPYCIFNPVDHGLGSKSCACVSGLLSVNPSGEILPCSSYDKGIGSLLKHSFKHIWNSDQALYYREKRYVPPVCKKCELEKLCSGGCPLYWENAGSFKEIEDVRNKPLIFNNLIWLLEKTVRTRSKGIKGIRGTK